MGLHYLEDVRWRRFITFTWQMPNKTPKILSEGWQSQRYFYNTTKMLFASFSFFHNYTVGYSSSYVMHENEKHGCRRKIQFSSIKKDIKEICKNVKQWHFSLFFVLENKDFKNKNVLFILYAMSLLLFYKRIIYFRSSQLKNLRNIDR